MDVNELVPIGTSNREQIFQQVDDAYDDDDHAYDLLGAVRRAAVN
jgi:hypothetical protein